MSRLTINLGTKQKCNIIPIGRVGENVVTEIAFDFSAWAEEYGTGNVALVAQRNGDANPYPVTLTVSGTVAVWSITDTDVAITGMGKAQVSYIVGEAVKKSDIFQTVCKNSLPGTGEAPDPYEDWMDALERLTAQNSAYAQQASESATSAFESAEQAQEALEQFESVTVSAETLPEGSSATASYADGHIAFGIPKGDTGATGATGPQGEQGADGADGITPDLSIGTVETLPAGSDATATITGTQANPVLNLGIPKGDPGEVTQAEFDALEKEIYNTSETTDSGVYMKRLTDNGELAGQKIMYENLEVIGGSLVWNQLMKTVDSGNYNSYQAAVSFDDGVATLSASGNYGRLVTKNSAFPTIVAGHKYIIMADIKTNFSHSLYPINADIGGNIGSAKTPTANLWMTYTIAFQPSTATVARIFFGDVSSYYAEGDEVQVRNIMLIDLTAMFGSTIADYIYSLEQSNAGTGIAWFKKYLPEDYYPYSAPTLQSVNTSAHIMKDANDETVGIYALDADLELRGMPKLDADNNLVYDGDVYEADGTVTRKYGIVDLGTLNYAYNSTAHAFTLNINNIGIKANTINMVLSSSVYTLSNTGADKTYMVGLVNFVVYDSSYTDAATFKAAMSGVYLVYELATETTEQANPYTNPQHADADGTEEFVCSNNVPVGNITTYKVQSSKLPSPPTTDGTYTLTATVTDGVPRFTWEQ